jgi:imidazolonepropionase-like amidohydrolase
VQQLITAGQVLTGPAGGRIANGAVLVDGQTITAVGPRGEIEPRAGRDCRRRDYPRHTLLPGLINCHVHLALDASATPVDNLQAAGDTDLLAGMAARAGEALAAGVTTVRDLGDRGGLAIRLRDRITSNGEPGPRIVASGPPLTIPGGHCWFFGGTVDGEDEIRRQVRRNAALGADVIKVMASGGQITPGSPPMWASQFTPGQLRMVVEEATALGLPVAAHAHGTEAIAAAAEAGVTTIEHCTWMRAGGGFDRREDVAARMAGRGIYACSAMSRNWRAFMDRLGPERAEQILDRIRWLDRVGVPLIPGTDAGLPTSVFGDFAGALGLYEHLGFSPGRIIEMATVTSAAALGLGDRTGQVAPGYDADLLVTEGDPLTGLDALRRLVLVLARGRAAGTG